MKRQVYVLVQFTAEADDHDALVKRVARNLGSALPGAKLTAGKTPGAIMKWIRKRWIGSPGSDPFAEGGK